MRNALPSLRIRGLSRLARLPKGYACLLIKAMSGIVAASFLSSLTVCAHAEETRYAYDAAGRLTGVVASDAARGS